jgi:hypothetical protein
MYSYEDRVRAVELYLKLGKRIKATIRQLGYRTKNSLEAWCQEFEKSGDLQKACVRPKTKCSEEQKNLALEHYVNHRRCFSFTLRALGYATHFFLSPIVLLMAIRAGVGYGLVPSMQIQSLIDAGDVISLAPQHRIAVSLYWHH